ncbi:hypothetical protein ACFRQM_48115 [Streptomyces sp. NPDC056831]|uniref:hypothetical protein n=1 Tax=Streptomyces sp. NPDC056831 TaxID=3345954 RepID=UPI0036B47612
MPPQQARVALSRRPGLQHACVAARRCTRVVRPAHRTALTLDTAQRGRTDAFQATAAGAEPLATRPALLRSWPILGIGPYSEFGAVREVEALKLFTQRVEGHRNEQRRRQQQLDQPSDQAAPSSQPSA